MAKTGKGSQLEQNLHTFLTRKEVEELHQENATLKEDNIYLRDSRRNYAIEIEALKAEVERLRKLAYNLSTGNLKSMPGNDSYNRGYLDGAKMAGDNITKALNHKEG